MGEPRQGSKRALERRREVGAPLTEQKCGMQCIGRSVVIKRALWSMLCVEVGIPCWASGLDSGSPGGRGLRGRAEVEVASQCNLDDEWANKAKGLVGGAGIVLQFFGETGGEHTFWPECRFSGPPISWLDLWFLIFQNEPNVDGETLNTGDETPRDVSPIH